jgi:hypothetical protein
LRGILLLTSNERPLGGVYPDEGGGSGRLAFS